MQEVSRERDALITRVEQLSGSLQGQTNVAEVSHLSISLYIHISWYYMWIS